MRFALLLASSDDSAVLVIVGLFVLSLFWIFYLKDKFWRSILGPPAHEVLAKQANALIDSQIATFQSRVDRLCGEMAEREERARNGKSPITVETIEQRRRSLDSVSRLIADAKRPESQSNPKRGEEVLAAYLQAAIEIKSDSVRELEFALAAAENAQSKTGAVAAAESIGELRAHINAARASLDAARQATENIAVARGYDAAVASIQAGDTIANALRIGGLA